MECWDAHQALRTPPKTTRPSWCSTQTVNLKPSLYHQSKLMDSYQRCRPETLLQLSCHPSVLLPPSKLRRPLFILGGSRSGSGKRAYITKLRVGVDKTCGPDPAHLHRAAASPDPTPIVCGADQTKLGSAPPGDIPPIPHAAPGDPTPHRAVGLDRFQDGRVHTARCLFRSCPASSASFAACE